ncbi:MAG: DinB family protein [Byssovorax cruenta]
MATQSQIRSKEQLLSGWIEVRQQIIQEVIPITDQDRDRPFLGIWSIKDMLAHLAGWDYANLEGVRAILVGMPPPFYSYHDRDWKKYNAMLVAKYKRDSFPELIELLKESQQALTEFLDTVPAEAFNRDFGVRFRGYKVTIKRLLEAETRDEQIHYQQIKDYFKESK